MDPNTGTSEVAASQRSQYGSVDNETVIVERPSETAPVIECHSDRDTGGG